MKKYRTYGFGTLYQTFDGYTTRNKQEAEFIDEIHEEVEYDKWKRSFAEEMRLARIHDLARKKKTEKRD